MVLPAKAFYMIRHGQSVANRDQYFSGNTDVALTDLGREQANAAQKAFEKLTQKPDIIIHSHLQRARITAEILNKPYGIPMLERADVGEHHFGDWEGQPYDLYRDRFDAGENPPNGEPHEAFHMRIQGAFTEILETYERPLIVCHGGVFRAVHGLYEAPFQKVQNAILHHFEPYDDASFPWEIKIIS